MPENLLLYLIFPLVIMVVCLNLKGKRSPETIQGVATLFGIFGTFAGIIYALWGININDLSNSIGQILDGIYPAFFSSLTGVLMSLLVFLYPNSWKQTKQEEEQTATDKQILKELKKINENLSKGNEESVSKQILGLKKSFDNFAEKMADNNMKALEEVIKDFNTKLQEQFGENFKQLNEAVGKLLEWQENYKKTIKKNEENLKKAVESLNALNDASTSLKTIVENVKVFKENADELNNQLKGTMTAVTNITNFSNNLSGKADEIQKSVESIVTSSVEELGQNLLAVTQAMVRDYEQIQTLIQNILDTRNENN